MNSLRNVLVPIDGSPPSLAALDHAVELALSSDAAIAALYVEVSNTQEIGSIAPASPDARKRAEEEMSAALQRAQDRLGARLSRLRVAGDPLRKILETAAEGDYQLIVIGTHGWVGRLHAIFGSVAEGVVRNAPCPVLTVRQPGTGYQSFAERRHGNPSLAEQIERHDH